MKVTYKDIELAGKLRELEMRLDAICDDTGVKLQFFADLKLYGLREALAYLKGYSRAGKVRGPLSDRVAFEGYCQGLIFDIAGAVTRFGTDGIDWLQQ